MKDSLEDLIGRKLTPIEDGIVRSIGRNWNQADRLEVVIESATKSDKEFQREVIDQAAIERIRLEYRVNKDLDSLLSKDSKEVYEAIKDEYFFKYRWETIDGIIYNNVVKGNSSGARHPLEGDTWTTEGKEGAASDAKHEFAYENQGNFKSLVGASFDMALAGKAGGSGKLAAPRTGNPALDRMSGDVASSAAQSAASSGGAGYGLADLLMGDLDYETSIEALSRYFFGERLLPDV